jgi:predicted RNase H-like HicB family nuclease
VAAKVQRDPGGGDHNGAATGHHDVVIQSVGARLIDEPGRCRRLSGARGEQDASGQQAQQSDGDERYLHCFPSPIQDAAGLDLEPRARFVLRSAYSANTHYGIRTDKKILRSAAGSRCPGARPWVERSCVFYSGTVATTWTSGQEKRGETRNFCKSSQRESYGPVWREREQTMKIKVVVHEAEEGGYWAEVPAIPGCATQGESFEELLQNLYEAIEGCLSVDLEPSTQTGKERVLEIAV